MLGILLSRGEIREPMGLSDTLMSRAYTYRDRVDALKQARKEIRELPIRSKEFAVLHDVIVILNENIKELNQSVGQVFSPKGNYGYIKIN